MGLLNLDEDSFTASNLYETVANQEAKTQNYEQQLIQQNSKKLSQTQESKEVHTDELNRLIYAKLQRV